MPLTSVKRPSETEKAIRTVVLLALGMSDATMFSPSRANVGWGVSGVPPKVASAALPQTIIIATQMEKNMISGFHDV
jgi:hypothetical protein